MRSDAFWNWFNAEAGPRLALREISFRKVFAYLDSINGPLTIVETGCARAQGNWAGDGQSSVLFDKYLECRGEGSSPTIKRAGPDWSGDWCFCYIRPH